MAKQEAAPRQLSSKSTTSAPQRGMWGTDIPWVHWKDKRPHERPKSLINHEVTPSWAWGETTSEADRHKAGWAQTRTASQH
jgi:hypothetical protein